MHRVSDFCMRANVIDVNFMTVTITIRIVNWFSAKDRADDGREREIEGKKERKICDYECSHTLCCSICRRNKGYHLF